MKKADIYTWTLVHFKTLIFNLRLHNCFCMNFYTTKRKEDLSNDTKYITVGHIVSGKVSSIIYNCAPGLQKWKEKLYNFHELAPKHKSGADLMHTCDSGTGVLHIAQSVSVRWIQIKAFWVTSHCTKLSLCKLKWCSI